jgi:hypothetical protein
MGLEMECHVGFMVDEVSQEFPFEFRLFSSGHTPLLLIYLHQSALHCIISPEAWDSISDPAHASSQSIKQIEFL